MDALARDTQEGREQVETVFRLYDEWITEHEGLIPDLLPRFRSAATRHMALCREALERMRAGWQLVGSSTIAARAFRLANEAMLYQQMRSRLPLREVERGRDDTLRSGAAPRGGTSAGLRQLAPVPDRLHAGQPARAGRPHASVTGRWST